MYMTRSPFKCMAKHRLRLVSKPDSKDRGRQSFLFTIESVAFKLPSSRPHTRICWNILNIRTCRPLTHVSLRRLLLSDSYRAVCSISRVLQRSKFDAVEYLSWWPSLKSDSCVSTLHRLWKGSPGNSWPRSLVGSATSCLFPASRAGSIRIV